MIVRFPKKAIVSFLQYLPVAISFTADLCFNLREQIRPDPEHHCGNDAKHDQVQTDPEMSLVDKRTTQPIHAVGERVDPGNN